MSRAYEIGDEDEDGEIAVCPECDGSGKDADYDPAEWEDEDGELHPLAPNGDCPVCCGFGRIDW